MCGTLGLERLNTSLKVTKGEDNLFLTSTQDQPTPMPMLCAPSQS